jgi:nucleotide-binding universal stress UspA family protein
MTQHKILWPTDLSAAAAQALPTVRDMVHRRSSEVHLLYVTDDLAGFESYWGTGPDRKHREGLRAFAERKAKERLQHICDCELEGCPNYQLHVALGNTAEEVTRAANELGVDVIVVAKPPTEGETSFGAAVDGLLEQAPVPVEVVHVPATAEAPACGGQP